MSAIAVTVFNLHCDAPGCTNRYYGSVHGNLDTLRVNAQAIGHWSSTEEAMKQGQVGFLVHKDFCEKHRP